MDEYRSISGWAHDTGHRDFLFTSQPAESVHARPLSPFFDAALQKLKHFTRDAPS